MLDDLQKLFPSATESDLRSALRSVRSSTGTVGILALVASAWVASSFWGALDTAFCRIYHLPCRSWVRQKIFALGMLVVVLAFFAASVAIPVLQGLWVSTARDLPLGLSHVRGLIYAVSLLASLLLLFGMLCLIYWRVPKGAIPWTCVWPGALGRDARDGGRGLAVPALPGRGEHAAHRARRRRLRPDRADLVLVAVADPAVRGGRQRAALRGPPGRPLPDVGFRPSGARSLKPGLSPPM